MNNHYHIGGSILALIAENYDKDFSYVAAWEYNKEIKESKLHKEDLEFKEVKLTSRSYK